MTTVPVLAFATASDGVVCGDVPTGGLGALTIEGWYLVLDMSGGNRSLLAKYGTTGQEWALYVTSDARLYLVVYHAGGVSLGYSAAGAVAAGPWVHLAGCYDGTHSKVWVNGADVTQSSRPASGAPVVANTTQDVQIGGVLGEAAWPFVGRAGWQRISNVCRYPGAPGTPDGYPWVDGDTLAQWNLSEGSGVTADNAQGTALYDGLISGAVWRAAVVDDKRRAQPVLVRAYAPVWSRGVRIG